MRKTWNLLARSLVIALLYTAANAVIGGLVMQGMDAPGAGQATPALLLATTFLSGFLLAAVLGPVARLLTTPRTGTMALLANLIFLNLASVIIEGYFFAPGLLPGALVPRVLALQALTSFIAAGAIVLFFPAPAPTTYEPQGPKRSLPAWAGRFLASAVAYLLFYYFFGAINYALITGPYYETHGGLAVPPPQTVIVVEAVRSVMIILSLLPLILSLHAPRERTAWLCGMLLFFAGGLLPLLTQTAAMPLRLLVASGVEIFFQNFLTGVVAALLLGRPQAAPARPHPAPAVAEKEKA